MTEHDDDSTIRTTDQPGLAGPTGTPERNGCPAPANTPAPADAPVSTDTPQPSEPKLRRISREAVLAALAADAVISAPRLFAIYGVQGDDDDLEAVRGWGMDFGDGEALAIYPDDNSIHRSDSAERILRTNNLVSDSHLVWLTESAALVEPA